MKTEDIIKYEHFVFDFQREKEYIQTFDDKSKCPLCGEPLVIYGHCKTCYSCGWSSCDL